MNTNNSDKKPLTRRQAGRLGGKATVAAHGVEHMSTIGKRGAASFWKRYRLIPIDLADFAIVCRNTGKVINVLYNNSGLRDRIKPNDHRSDD